MTSVQHQILRYIVLIILSIFPLIAILILYLIEPLHRNFSIYDISIAHEYKNDTVSNPLVNGLTFGSSLLFAAVYCIFSPAKCQSILSCIMSLFFGFGITKSFTQLLKITVGRLRPDFLQRCKPDQEDVRMHSIEDMRIFGQLLSHDFKCTGDAQIVKEGHMSFPSGHASSISYAFAFCSFLAFFWCYRYIQQKKQTGMSRIFLLMICLTLSQTLILIALYTSSSRVSDNRHNISDVIFGFIIGVIGGIISGLIIWIFECIEKWEESDEQVI
ncbi:MAG: phosphatidate phosphatase [Streblomastix strix]|uniref:Phosphatidate phosphatase n=1 Tax=Streblomastix strix TaxID=222440 RepID=A0A5J4V5M3_9EUKA|nr:MAG: phosphatidate phosphatase [Streblomastix strix]